MKKGHYNAIVLVTAGIFLIGCSSDDGENPTIVPDRNTVIAPASYEFTRNDISTVSFSGQTTRIEMAEALITGLTDATASQAALDGMFAHVAGANDFADADLNASDKSIRSKIAASNDYFSANTTDGLAIKEQFDSWIAAQVTDVLPKWDDLATAGIAGSIQEAGGGSKRYVNAKGLELNQAIAKSLIGGLMVDQMLNNYLGSAVLDEADNRAKNDTATPADGKDYTTMEHKWDEAFGYLYGREDNPTIPALSADSFLNKYVAKVAADDDFSAIGQTIFNAFKLGRAAIVAKNYDVRDAQIATLRKEISKVIGIRAVYYLQQGKANLAQDKASAFHDLSEGFGFVYSLQFTRIPGTATPYFTKNEVDAVLAQLMAGNGFWDVTEATLDAISTQIAAEFDFSVAQAAD